MYYCLNFVTESIGFPAAVLIRGILADHHYNGPDKLCRYYGIDTTDNNVDIICDPNFISLIMVIVMTLIVILGLVLPKD